MLPEKLSGAILPTASASPTENRATDSPSIRTSSSCGDEKPMM